MPVNHFNLQALIFFEMKFVGWTGRELVLQYFENQITCKFGNISTH